MSIDFKANQIRTSQLIVTGAKSDTPALIVYGSGSSTNFTGAYLNTLLSSVGTDAFIFVSGTIGSKGIAKSVGTAVVGGDVVISGTLYNGAGVAYSTSGAGIGGANKNVQYNNAGSLAGSNNLNFDGTNLILTGSSLIKGSLFPSGTVGITGSLVIKDDTADTSQLTLSSSAGNTIFNMYSDGTFYLTNNKSSGQIAVGVTQPDAAGSQVLKIYPKNSQQSLSVFNESLAGSSAANPNLSSDTNFFVNGLISSRGTSNRGTAVFGGDLVTSGSLYALNGNATVSATAGSSIITLTSAGGSTTFTETNSGNLEIRNTALAGQFVASVKTSGGVTSNFLDVRPNGSLTGSVISIFPSSIYTGAANPFSSSDTTFFVAGKSGAKGGNTRGTAVFGGDTVISGSAYLGTSNTDNLVVNSLLASDIIPDGNRTRNLGSDTARFANVYTGDLHLRNERGDYTLIEEEECLTIRFNKTGKRYKFVLERAPEYDE
jgi:hypothetical protein